MFQPDGEVPGDAMRQTTLQVLELGKDQAVALQAGTSQCMVQSISACGLAAFNFARIGFRIEQSKKQIGEVLNELSRWKIAEEIVAICEGWSSTLHLEVEEIHELPIFGKSLELMCVEYGRPRRKFFRKTLEKMKKMEKSVVMIIRRVPEIIACFKFSSSNAEASTVGTVENPVFVVFDSQSRPSHPHGAGLFFSTSIENTAHALSDILPAMDESMHNSPEYAWQAQLLETCSAHLYVARQRRKDHEEAIVQSTLAILNLRAELLELKREIEELSSENKSLESEVDDLRTSVRQLKAKGKAYSSQMELPDRVLGGTFASYPQTVVGSSRLSELYNRIRETVPSHPHDTAGAQSIFSDNPLPIPSELASAHDDPNPENNESEEYDDSWMENPLFYGQPEQVTLPCGICMEELLEDEFATVDDCAHATCRSCLKEYVDTKIQERRYPISCPMCTASTESNTQSSAISRFLIEELGISEEQSEILTEMELAQFIIQLHCHKCRRPAPVDREDYSNAICASCPHADCDNVWCKNCEQTIVADGPQNSCDGSSELDYLMREQGWKYCPSCRTPIQKVSGCNHMSCISPGCNTQFCYVCGGRIVGSVSEHFRNGRCQQFT